MDFIETNWLLLLIVLVLAALVAWYVFHAARRTRISGDRRDVLDEGAAPAARNQALIDAPAPVAKPQPATVRPGEPAVTSAAGPASGNDLHRLKGVGPKLVAELERLGVTGLAQIAAWTPADVERIDAQLGRFQGRIERDDWVGQARLLTEGDEAGYARRFGNIS